MLVHGKSSAEGIESGWMEGRRVLYFYSKIFKNILKLQLYFKDRFSIYSHLDKLKMHFKCPFNSNFTA